MSTPVAISLLSMILRNQRIMLASVPLYPFIAVHCGRVHGVLASRDVREGDGPLRVLLRVPGRGVRRHLGLGRCSGKRRYLRRYSQSVQGNVVFLLI